MNPEKLDVLLEDIEKSEIANPLVTKLSKEFEISEPVVKSTLKMLIMMINGISKN